MSEPIVKVYPNQEISSKLPIEVEVLDFSYSEKSGSSFIGRAHVIVRGLIPDSDCGLELRNISLFAPFDKSDPDEKSKCRFPQTKEADAWVPLITLVTPDKQLHFRVLAHIRRAVEAYLEARTNPKQAFDELAPEHPSLVSDSDIPY